MRDEGRGKKEELYPDNLGIAGLERTLAEVDWLLFSAKVFSLRFHLC